MVHILALGEQYVAYIHDEHNRCFWLLKDEANLTVIVSDCGRYIRGYPPVHKKAARQRNQTPATVNNDSKCNCQAHELILWQAPPTIQPSGWELQSGDTALLVICYNRGRSLVSSDPTDHFQLLPRPQEASHPQCSSVCVCVCCVEVQQGRGLLSLDFPPWLERMGGHSVAQLKLSISLFLWVHSVESKQHTLRARDVTSSQACCSFTCQGCIVKITNRKGILSFAFRLNQIYWILVPLGLFDWKNCIIVTFGWSGKVYKRKYQEKQITANAIETDIAN